MRAQDSTRALSDQECFDKHPWWLGFLLHTISSPNRILCACPSLSYLSFTYPSLSFPYQLLTLLSGPQLCLPINLATSQITVCSPVPNRPPLRCPTAYPTAGNRRVEKRPRLTEVGEGDFVTEGSNSVVECGDTADGGSAEVFDVGDETGDIQVLQR